MREILITNDDSYTSKGIKVIIKLLAEYGNVTVVAPKEPQSGKSVAVTLNAPLRFNLHETYTHTNGNKVTIYTLTGTPSDCVKMAMNDLFVNDLPDLLISGINHGSNASSGALYSGTLGAAIEGTLYNIPSIGVSVDDHSADADFSAVETILPKILDNYFKTKLDKGVYLNINFPKCSPEAIKGVKIARQGKGRWTKEFERRIDPHGKPYYWMSGEFINTDTETTDADHILLENKYVTIVPHKIDTTDYNSVKLLESNWIL